MPHALPATTRRRFDIQGFENVGDDLLFEAGPWLRLSFGLCAVFTGIGTALASPVILLALAVVAASAAAFSVHPFDALYNISIRRLAGGRKLPHRGIPSRFACGCATAVMIATAWSFDSGSLGLGTLLGSTIALVAALVSFTDICVLSMIYRAVFGWPAPREATRGRPGDDGFWNAAGH